VSFIVKVKLTDAKYGMTFGHPVSPLEVELYAFRLGLGPDEGGLGKYEHFRNAANIIWPEIIWNPWLERQIESLCNHDWVSWTGCAASGKTYASSLYALVWWLSDPTHSSVILSSTTAKMIRKRAWSNIQQLWRTSSGQFPGNMVDSKTTLQATKGDDKNAIFAIAVLDGSTSKAVANIQGIHSERILAIVDEATDTPEAAFEATANLSKGCKTFQFLAIGNPHSTLDEHGRFSEPVDGWDSVGIETDEWATKRGVCLRFDGMRSPNIAAGKTKWEFLITQEQIDTSLKYEGENSPRFWKYTRGMWSPEGVCKTVLSETMCHKYRVNGTHVFGRKSHIIAGLDPAFGGDRCVLRFAKYGDLRNGLMGVEFTDIVYIQLNTQSSEPIHFQIAKQVKEACISRGCEPQHLAIDATGEGGGLCDILHKEWSSHIRRVEFGGKASQLPTTQEDPRPSHEAYANRVTELWFSVREWVIREQVKGLDHETIIEFCQRMFDDEKRKIVVERKVDMKGRTGQSPDLADAAALIVEMARNLGAGHLNIRPEDDKEWETLSLKYDKIYNEESMYAGTG
tara:strand:+ start:1325 stop:3028 length:1704 start_codon:yes stop_codon:yes gene_type:complete